ncbi:hypothetical protein QUF54_00080 [Candidatus Marithioploca araucensis]|uniref:7(1) septoil knot domain-containing protein n=1 Tax=Candidatus Marithioploca araucensis TaxID=70273 RepID=A0ABT7VQ08_9GAMM|nr:hypothetical protein [Candidatus Marithioploca araucensis]
MYKLVSFLIIPVLLFLGGIDDKIQLSDKDGINNDCEFNGISLYGKVQIVTSFPDIKIQYVESFPELRVKFVTSFPDNCGEWQLVESFPDFKVEIVESFPDLKVKKVDSFPGVE